MLTLVIALVSCIGVVVASIVNHRAVTTAAKIAAGDTVRFAAALIAALAQLDAAQLQHDSRGRPHPGRRDDRGRAPGARLTTAAYGACTASGPTGRAARSHAHRDRTGVR